MEKNILQNNDKIDDKIDNDIADFIAELEELYTGEDFYLPF